MMKFQYLASLLGGGMMIIPAVALRGQDGPGGIVAALSQTVTALEELTGIKSQIESGDRSAVQRILQATEMPVLAARERDERLFDLRGELSALQMMLDELRSGAGTGASTRVSAPVAVAAQGATPMPPTPMPRAIGTTGLSEDLRASIARRGRGEPERIELPSAETVEREGPGFSADAKRQGKLLVRSGRYLEAIRVLMPIEGDAEAKYWIARSFQKLDRDQEARELLRSLVEDEAAGIYASRAKHDLAFLQAKAQLESRRRGAGL